MSKILIIEDDTALAGLYKSVLERAHHQPFIASDGEDALNLMENEYIDLIITDVMMPHIDGFEFTKLLRETGNNIPILMVTAKGNFDDKKLGFRIGVDDYMVKPIDVKELVLRVNALLRRYKIANSNILTIGSTTLDQSTYTATYKGESKQLAQKEFQLLHKLLSYPDRIFTRQQLMDEIWGLDSESDERTVDVHIKRLRDHFRENPDFTIVTVRGLGYKIEVNV